jgi:two-component flavin-dependent monooxygenase
MTALGTERPSLLQSAATAAECAAAHAAEAEKNRRLCVEVVAALTDAGLARHFVPAWWGGTAGGFAEAGQAIATIGEGCLSAAWCGLIYATSARMAALLPLAGQQDLWSVHPDVLIAAGLVPGGTATETRGGWLLSGTWQPLSGVDFADWLLLCAPVLGRDPKQLFFFAVPRGNYEIVDTWDTVGMRGTGSKTVVLSGAFVPIHRMFAQQSLVTGAGDPARANCHRAPLLAVAPPMFLAPALGAARGALAAWVASVADRRTPQGPPATAAAYNHQVLAQVSTELDAVDLLLQRALNVADSGRVTAELGARNARDASYGAQLLVTAVDRLFQAGGAPAQRSGDLLQRVWRDTHCAVSHAALRSDRAAQHYAGAIWAVSAP